MRPHANAAPAATRRRSRSAGAAGSVGVGDGRIATRARCRRLPKAALAASIACLSVLIAAPLARADFPSRAYEMVSPVEKGNSKVRGIVEGNGEGELIGFPGEFGFQTSADGNSMVYAVQNALPGGEAAPLTPLMLGKRTEGGWSSTSVDPPLFEAAVGVRAVQTTIAVSEDDTHALVISSRRLTPGAVEYQPNLYVKNLETDTYEFIASSTNPTFAGMVDSEGTWAYVGGTSDFSAVAFSIGGNLTGESPASIAAYLWTRTGGLKLASILPDGTPAPGVAGNGSSEPYAKNQLSANGKRLYVVGFNGGPGTEGLFLYENGHTRAISVSHIEGASQEPVQARFQGATADGNEVIFTNRGRAVPLTPEAPPHLEGSTYRANVETGELTFIAPAVRSVLGTSSDLSYVYYESVDPEEGPGEKVKVSHDGTTKLIATGAGAFEAVVSPNGHFLAFRSPVDLTGYDNAAGGHCPGGCSEIFLYDALTETLSCVSCRSDGGPATGNATLSRNGNIVALSRRKANAVTNSGQVFFSTPDPLVKQDVNGNYDVYEGSPQGVALISSGTTNTRSVVADATPDGSNVFFVTTSQLVAQDKDTLADLYDARVGGGIASQDAVEEEGCSAEICTLGSSTVTAQTSPSSGSEMTQGVAKAKKPKKAAKKHRKTRCSNGKARGKSHSGACKKSHVGGKNGGKGR